jgi:Tannase-like family of unknown function (DUF6351)
MTRKLGACLVAAVLFLSVVSAVPSGATSSQGSAGVRVLVVSNRADVISGGDALIRVRLPAGVSAARVELNGSDVTDSFALRVNGRYEGLLTGLRLGWNVVRAEVGGLADSVVITNHPNGGPVFSGPQVEPWVCQATAVDRKCNQPPAYSFLYKSTNPFTTGLQPYDRADPPSDVATTTTDQGVTVPFVVRLETGYQDRDQYKIFQLYQPGKTWRPWAPQRQWNHKLLVTHGGGCGADHGAGEAPTDDSAGTLPVNLYEQSYVTALGRGFAVLSTALDNNGHNCNPVTQAESLIMAKERLVEQYGPIRYTIGTGCSGGSITQQTVANAYPGVYQGLVTTCSYPDTLTAGAQFADYHLMRRYFEDPSRWGPGIVWLPWQVSAVEGHLSHLNAIVADEGLFKNATDPTYACHGVTDSERYHPTTNPDGVRCSILDHMVNVLGPRPKRVWSPMEQAAGRGFAGLPLGNAGIQYGLKAWRQGWITTEQFVDLNAAIGGLTVDIQPKSARTRGDVGALRNAYRSGAINQANNLDTVAILNHGGPDPGLAHDYSHAFWTRARLEREQGHIDNHVMWFGVVPLIGDPSWSTEAMLAMDRWLTAVEADHRAIPLADKIVADRPDDVHDRCSNLPLLELVELPGVGKVCELPLLQTRFGTPRSVAGDGPTADTNACVLKPLRRTSYYPYTLTDEQWQRLETAFPRGVCDYSEPGVGQTDTVRWLTYQDSDGDVVYGGRPMGAAPDGSGIGWTSAAFRTWRRG